MEQLEKDEKYMRLALALAHEAALAGEVPVGAVAVSYTHLDVYKRQGSHPPACMPGWAGKQYGAFVAMAFP